MLPVADPAVWCQLSPYCIWRHFKPGDFALRLETWRLGIAALSVTGSVLPPEAVAVSESLQASEP